jgi:hypothetical protein
VCQEIKVTLTEFEEAKAKAAAEVSHHRQSADRHKANNRMADYRVCEERVANVVRLAVRGLARNYPQTDRDEMVACGMSQCAKSINEFMESDWNATEFLDTCNRYARRAMQDHMQQAKMGGITNVGALNRCAGGKEAARMKGMGPVEFIEMVLGRGLSEYERSEVIDASKRKAFMVALGSFVSSAILSTEDYWHEACWDGGVEDATTRIAAEQIMAGMTPAMKNAVEKTSKGDALNQAERKGLQRARQMATGVMALTPAIFFLG